MSTELDVARARRETPGCESVLHLDNAGSSLPPARVLSSVIDHLTLEATIGGYAAEEQARSQLEETYRQVAALINCRPDEVALTENATRAWDMAFYGIPFRPGDRILTDRAAYASNYIAFLQVAQKQGVSVEEVPDDDQGQVCIGSLRRMINDRVRLVAITHVPTNGGLVNPAAAVGEIAREAGILYLLDACQSVGQMPIDVDRIGCDMLSATGRKFLRGPRGTGFLYVRRAVLDRIEPPLLDIHAATWTARNRYEVRQDARRFENWESYVAGRIGLGVAIDYARSWGLEAIWHRVQSLADRLRARLNELPGVTVRDKGAVKCGIVSFTKEGLVAPDIARRLRRQRVNVSTSTVFSTRLDMESRQLADVVRASLHYYNSEDEIDRFVGLVAGMGQV